jgi:hypothetical protein
MPSQNDEPGLFAGDVVADQEPEVLEMTRQPESASPLGIELLSSDYCFYQHQGACSMNPGGLFLQRHKPNP